MPFGQISSAWNDGKRPKGGPAIETDADVERINRHWRRYLHGF